MERPALVLIVDDDPQVRSTLRRCLERLKVDVLEAEHGERALELAGQFRPDLILLDLQMPGIDGFEVLRRLPDGPQRSRVLVVSASGDRGCQQLARQLGADDYLAKPFSARVLQALVEQLLAAPVGGRAPS